VEVLVVEIVHRMVVQEVQVEVVLIVLVLLVQEILLL
tara:strand:- start:297 stop:407 length:111 start_codon:yes stop_codon:yes gene_type:complete